MAKHSIAPLGDRVLVEVLPEKEAKTASGIYLPSQSEDTSLKKGKVLAIGQLENEQVSLKEGDTVLFSLGFDAKKVTPAGTLDVEQYVVKFEDVLAVVK